MLQFVETERSSLWSTVTAKSELLPPTKEPIIINN